VHQLKDPSAVLKVGADMFPHLKIIATGASTLAASRKFKDTLAGRKRLVHLTPVLWDEFPAFNNATLHKRLYHGELPQALLSEGKQPSFYREWADSFFAIDIQKLFAFRDPDKFNMFFEYLLKQSGGLFNAPKASSALGISRPTIENHSRALQTTYTVTLLRPFYGFGKKEIIKMQKVYCFNTGFVSLYRGWEPLRQDDYGIPWEHLVLEHLQAHMYNNTIHYWRDISGREIDFVIARDRETIDAIECKWDQGQFDPDPLKVFRSYYPRGENYLVCPVSTPPYVKILPVWKLKYARRKVLLPSTGVFLRNGRKTKKVKYK